jgi:hypothetical protein
MNRLFEAVVRWLLHPSAAEREALCRLRAALRDAADHCPQCAGVGRVALPAGWIVCARCAPWRRVLITTRRV